MKAIYFGNKTCVEYTGWTTWSHDLYGIDVYIFKSYKGDQFEALANELSFIKS